MSEIEQCRLEIDQLRSENIQLRDRIVTLETQLLFLSQHKTLAAGITGETLISRLVNGKLTVHTSPVDVITSIGWKIEVKMAKLTYPSPGSRSNPSRWQWGKIFGEKNAKDFDYLILIGEGDRRHHSYYKEVNSPYVIFLLDRKDADRLSTAHTNGARGILLTCNPNSDHPKAIEFFKNFQVTTVELSEMLGVGLD